MNTKILIVDDEIDIVLMLRSFFESKGYLVLFAKNEQVLNILFDKFKNHEIQKKYLALVYGIPKIKKARQLRNTIFILLRFIQIQLNVFQSIIVLDVGIELSPYIYIQKITKIMPKSDQSLKYTKKSHYYINKKTV